MSSSPSPRLSSPLPSTPGRYGGVPLRESTPGTTDSNLRSRFFGSRFGDAEPTPGDASPTSTTLSSVFNRSSIPLSASSALSSNFDNPKRKITIRADPTLVTCFDTADKELYDLWAPKR
ncbi:uncharacterized protein C8Q71DRAFT_852787 [Rhodofomes roseus]|uniref:Uncharacterized protein n=1 Tax=Rhodofomes roseus TaxID=34475 RepID=A0ABQ8KY95_9APHY|nr:uncharacterized protein C8Q71DRAFT_852787 [Rhodofomes roseus]KAH9844289.1 hypothetical protein C8Q71DRAFT_852787 [Rhodofomes roseus]